MARAGTVGNLFRFIGRPERAPVLKGEGVVLRIPDMEDYEAWSTLRAASRDFLQPWEPIWPDDDLTRRAFRSRIKRYRREIDAGEGYFYFVYRSGDGALVGGLALTNIRRGVAQTATLGYWIGLPFARKGFMTAAVRTVLPFVFSSLRLNRLEAACLPENDASIALLHKTGFKLEGRARGYLCINGAWRDHLLYARLSED
ncbi:MAG: GNAT family N-acetyltransferase [Hyphomicrobiales bacterium]|nr:GNAT family N-acetyltransferase [Hyphomicrobiales bacterium]